MYRETVKKYWYGRQDEKSRKRCTYHTMISDGDILGFGVAFQFLFGTRINGVQADLFVFVFFLIAYISCSVLYGEVKWNGIGKGSANILLPSYIFSFLAHSLLRPFSQ